MLNIEKETLEIKRVLYHSRGWPTINGLIPLKN